MPMTLYFKRAKCFVHQESDGGTKKFLAQPGPHPQPVPFWVADTPTFKQGVKDQSIVNLTPPEQMPGYKPAKAAVVEEVEGDEPEVVVPIDPAAEAAAEQTALPTPAFGGQPMTPVPPLPKIGNVRANAKNK